MNKKKKKNSTRIGSAVFHSVIKKVRFVRMAKKLVFLTSRCISLREINDYNRFEETPGNISPSQMSRESVLYSLRRNISRKVYALGDLIILTQQFHPFSHGKGVNVVKDSRQNSELLLRIRRRFLMSELENRLTYVQFPVGPQKL